MQYEHWTPEQIKNAKVASGIKSVEYIEALEKQLETAHINLAKANANVVVTDAFNTQHGANLNEIFSLFRNLPRSSNMHMELYWDGSGTIESQIPANILCSWDELDEAKAAIERAFGS